MFAMCNIEAAECAAHYFLVLRIPNLEGNAIAALQDLIVGGGGGSEGGGQGWKAADFLNIGGGGTVCTCMSPNAYSENHTIFPWISVLCKFPLPLRARLYVCVRVVCMFQGFMVFQVLNSPRQAMKNCSADKNCTSKLEFKRYTPTRAHQS